MGKFKCTAAGDAMVFKRFAGEYEGFNDLRDFIGQGDFRFLNLETTVHNFETYGAALSGGSWFCTEPEVVNDMHKYNFNILTTANNHSHDYGIEGLLLTLKYVKECGFPCAGTGKTLADASGPVYLDTPSGRYALIAGCSSFTADMMAGEQTRLMEGRPGINGITCKTLYQVTEEEFSQLEKIAEGTAINGADDIIRKEGYLPPLPEGRFVFGGLEFEKAEKTGKRTYPLARDMERTVKAIEEARFFADYVIISIHSHQIKNILKEEPSEFLEIFSRACIDAGADAVIGTGPHLIRPVEIYKGKPIFYSLGDFFLENETMKKVPAGMFEKQKLTGNENMRDMYELRSNHGKRGLYYSKVMFEAFVPYWEADENGNVTKIDLLPVELGYGKPQSQGGVPAPAFDKGILERLAQMSKSYGTEITIDENGIGHVVL
ncbi:MAG: CapA family protein [Eubacteriales bacterium]|nr:CapA family protein [Eubacteriales bacterium]